MSILKQPNYWHQVEATYKILGGSFDVKTSGKSEVRIPTNQNAYIVARELAATGSRKCLACGTIYEAKPGDVLKHCNRIMIANMPASLSKEIKASIGKYKIAIQKKIVSNNKEQAKQIVDKAENWAKEKKDKGWTKQDFAEGFSHINDSDDSWEKSKDEEVSKRSKEPKKESSYTAHFVKDDNKLGDSYWAVKAGNDLVLKVTLSQAFPGKEAIKAAPFSSSKYGEKLLQSVKTRGVEKTIAAKDGLNGRAINYKSAQVNTLAPDLFQEQTNVEEAGNQGQKPTDPQANDAMVDKAVGDEILEDKEDHSDVIELLKSAVVPFLVASNGDVTPEQFVQELRALSQNDDLLNEFQGSLDEMVKNFQHDEKSDEKQEEQEIQKEQSPNGEGAQAETGANPPADQQPMLTARKKETEALQRRLAVAEDANKSLLTSHEQLKREAMQLSQKNLQLLSENKMLLVDRTMRIRYPRCAKLAQMRVEIGEADNADQEIKALLKMPSGEFDALEKRVARVHVKVGRQPPDLDTEGVMSYLPEPRGDEKTASLKSGPRANNERKPAFADVWNRPIQ